MGHRVVVARPLGDSWSGFYVHWGLPCSLVEQLEQEVAKRGLAGFIEEYLTGDELRAYSSFPSGNYPGEREAPYTEQNSDPLHIEYVYVLLEQGLQVWASGSCLAGDPGAYVPGLDEPWRLGDASYRWNHAGIFPWGSLDGAEIQRLCDVIKESEYTRVAQELLRTGQRQLYKLT